MASASAAKAPGNRLFVLALGLLVGFVIGFVLLLSRLPVDGALSDFSAQDFKLGQGSGSGYQFYQILPDQTVARQAPPVAAIVQPQIARAAVIAPATRVVPANAQSLSPRSLAAEAYAEIPASSLGKESYFLQAGVYRSAKQAEKARAVVLLLGLKPYIEIRQGANGATGHHVRIGPLFDKSKVDEVKTRLQNGGVNYTLLRVTG